MDEAPRINVAPGIFDKNNKYSPLNKRSCYFSKKKKATMYNVHTTYRSSIETLVHTVESRFKKDLNLQIHLHMFFGWPVSDSVLTYFFLISNNSRFKKEKLGFLKSRFACCWKFAMGIQIILAYPFTIVFSNVGVHTLLNCTMHEQPKKGWM